MKRQNEVEAWQAYLRDQKQKETLINAQLKERQILQKDIMRAHQSHAKGIAHLHRDIAYYMKMDQIRGKNENRHDLIKQQRPPNRSDPTFEPGL